MAAETKKIVDTVYTCPYTESDRPAKPIGEVRNLVADLINKIMLDTRLENTPTLGWIPVDPMTKKPAVSKWMEVEKISLGRGRKRKEEKKYLDCRESYVSGLHNLGFHTGNRNNCTVVDVDLKNRGGELWPKLAVFHAGTLDKVYWVRTGGGGIHMYFDYEATLSNSVAIPRFEKKQVGIDVRNDGGYVVAAGSIHSSGYRYEESHDMAEFLAANDGKFTKMPEWLLRLCTTGSEIFMSDVGCSIVLPTDPKPDDVSKFTNINKETLLELMEFLPKDAAFASQPWRFGVMALRKIAEDFKIADITEVAIAFAKLAVRDDINQFDEKSTLELCRNRPHARQAGLSYFIAIARKHATAPADKAELESFLEEIRVQPKNVYWDMIRQACCAKGTTVETIEDLMMAS